MDNVARIMEEYTMYKFEEYIKKTLVMKMKESKLNQSLQQFSDLYKTLDKETQEIVNNEFNNWI